MNTSSDCSALPSDSVRGVGWCTVKFTVEFENRRGVVDCDADSADLNEDVLLKGLEGADLIAGCDEFTADGRVAFDGDGFCWAGGRFLILLSVMEREFLLMGNEVMMMTSFDRCDEESNSGDDDC